MAMEVGQTNLAEMSSLQDGNAFTSTRMRDSPAKTVFRHLGINATWSVPWIST